jgi:hypothetical protein
LVSHWDHENLGYKNLDAPGMPTKQLTYKYIFNRRRLIRWRYFSHLTSTNAPAYAKQSAIDSDPIVLQTIDVKVNNVQMIARLCMILDSVKVWHQTILIQQNLQILKESGDDMVYKSNYKYSTSNNYGRMRWSMACFPGYTKPRSNMQSYISNGRPTYKLAICFLLMTERTIVPCVPQKAEPQLLVKTNMQ